MFKLMLDAGHGGKDPGAISGVIRETDLNLGYVTRMEQTLFKCAHKTYITRIGDVFASLEARRAASQTLKPDAFISVHCNSFTSSSPRGLEVWVKSMDRAPSVDLANKILTSLIAFTGLPSRGIKAGNLYVLSQDIIRPAVLVEVGFLSNPTDRAFMTSPEGKEKITGGITEGILAYLRSKL